MANITCRRQTEVRNTCPALSKRLESVSPGGGTLQNVAITVDVSQVSYIGDGNVLVFSSVFPFLANSDVKVEKKLSGGSSFSTLTEGIDYTLVGAGQFDATTGARAAGSVTMEEAPAAGDTLRITRNTPVLQPTHLRSQGQFLPQSHETSFDRATMWGEDLERRLASVEAGTTGSTYTATRITTTFTVQNPYEDTFPIAVDAGVVPATVMIGRIQNLSTPAEVLDQPPSIQWVPGGGNVITIRRIDGLTVGQQYTITLEVRT